MGEKVEEYNMEEEDDENEDEGQGVCGVASKAKQEDGVGWVLPSRGKQKSTEPGCHRRI
jgi:hypothetical protein